MVEVGSWRHCSDVPDTLSAVQQPGDAAPEDSRIWVGRIRTGSEGEHEQHVAWLGSTEAQDVFRRRRLTEYALSEADGQVFVVFKAARTGDPRIMIDFLRYPGLWPEYWEFERGGRLEDIAPEDGPRGTRRVFWRRPAAKDRTEAHDS
jgi:hypothetical protein